MPYEIPLHCEVGELFVWELPNFVTALYGIEKLKWADSSMANAFIFCVMVCLQEGYLNMNESPLMEKIFRFQRYPAKEKTNEGGV